MVTDKRYEGNKNQSLNNLENVISKRLPVKVLRAGKRLLVFLQCLQDHANSIFNVFLIGLMESMRQADLKNWSLDQVQFADLCSSLNQFFTQTGLIHSQSNVQQNVCHGAMHPAKASQHIGTGMALVFFLIFSFSHSATV